SSHKLTLTQDFKGVLGSRGEKGAYIHLGPVPSRDEMELISRSVQLAPVGAAAGGAGRGVSFDSSCLSPLDTAGSGHPERAQALRCIGMFDPEVPVSPVVNGSQSRVTAPEMVHNCEQSATPPFSAEITEHRGGHGDPIPLEHAVLPAR
ncbi:hypothetical protein FQN60_014030, partial [Etheostoma spectabile]